jgi:hypothetical protein
MPTQDASADGIDDAAREMLSADRTAGETDAHDAPSRNPEEPARHGRRVSPQTEAILQRLDRLFWQHSLRRIRRDEKERNPE